METASFQEPSSDFITIDGIKCYDIQSAYGNPDYPAEDLHFLFEIEENYFWFKVRNLILRYLFERYLGRGPYKVMEIGAGNGIVLKALQSLGYQLTAAELYLTGLKNIQKRLPDIQLVQLNILTIPFREVYDAIGAFDVIEHIENDDKAIQNLYQALRPGGFLFLSVPQCSFLWSQTDVYSGHKRRYTRSSLFPKLCKQGFSIRYWTSFVFSLFPLILISRLRMKNKTVSYQDIRSEFDISSRANTILYHILSMDYYLIRLGIRLPFGSSLIVVCQRPQ